MHGRWVGVPVLTYYLSSFFLSSFFLYSRHCPYHRFFLFFLFSFSFSLLFIVSNYGWMERIWVWEEEIRGRGALRFLYGVGDFNLCRRFFLFSSFSFTADHVSFTRVVLSFFPPEAQVIILAIISLPAVRDLNRILNDYFPLVLFLPYFSPRTFPPPPSPRTFPPFPLLITDTPLLK